MASIIARGNDLPYLRNVTPRLFIANLDAVTKKRDLLIRFMRACRETVDWIYADPAAMAAFGKWAGMTEAIATRARDTAHADRAINCDKIAGLEQVMGDAVKFKFLATPMSEAQMGELFVTGLR